MERIVKSRRRRGMSLVEVMVASTIALIATVTSVGSIVYYQQTTVSNDKVTRLANLMESQMEMVHTQTWYNLINSETGLFPAGGFTNEGDLIVDWPAPGDTPVRYEARDLALELVADNILDQQFTGLNGTVRVFYTPLTLTHNAVNKAGQTVYFDVRYYKVDVVITLDPTSRVRAGAGEDEWILVTYLSELGGRSNAEFSQRILETLRKRQRA